jgi:hypothetical protein
VPDSLTRSAKSQAQGPEQAILLALFAHQGRLRPVMHAARPKPPNLDLTKRTALDEQEAVIASPFRAAIWRRRFVHDRCCRRQLHLLAQDPGLTGDDRLRSGLRFRRCRCPAQSAALLRRNSKCEFGDRGPGILSGRHLPRAADERRTCLSLLILGCTPGDRAQRKGTVDQLGCQAVTAAQAKCSAQVSGQAYPPIIVELYCGHDFDLSRDSGDRQTEKIVFGEVGRPALHLSVQLQDQSASRSNQGLYHLRQQ